VGDEREILAALGLVAAALEPLAPLAAEVDVPVLLVAGDGAGAAAVRGGGLGLTEDARDVVAQERLDVGAIMARSNSSGASASVSHTPASSRSTSASMPLAATTSRSCRA
jgi:hypothetical protein